MNSPFQFGRIVTEAYFTNRIKEINRLTLNINSNINTILISPRRWGKSSLVKYTSLQIEKKNKDIKFCFIDLFKHRSEEDFFKTYSEKVIRSASTKIEDWTAVTKNFFKKISPKITFGSDPINDFEISFDLKELQKNYDEILDLPEKISKKKNIKIIVCLDEFQNIGNFREPLLFQKRLRANWQHHKNVTYILYGSKRHMLMQLFEKKSMPFYKFGDVIYLNKIYSEHLINYIIYSFNGTKKKISKNIAERVVALVQCHPYYVQQLSHIIWGYTDISVTDEILELAVDDLINQNSILYQREIEDLTRTQINFLKAIVDKVKQLSSIQNILKYDIGTSANVVKIRKSLEKKEIVDLINSYVVFVDPVFELWFIRYYL